MKRKEMFDWICTLWKEHGDEAAVSRRVLTERLLNAGSSRAEIEKALDAFAKSGPDYGKFTKTLPGNFEPGGFYFRYLVIRNGGLFYVLRETLSEAERTNIATELRRKGDAALAKASALRQELDRRNRKLAVVR